MTPVPGGSPGPAAGVGGVGDSGGSDVVAAVWRELAAAGQAETPLGRLALLLAARLGSPADTGSATAALSKELRAVVAAALAAAPAAADPVDELRARRNARPTRTIRRRGRN